jgi:uncharacterized protein (DUF1330 family)
MNCYAIGYIENIKMGPAIRTYLENIHDTLAPFGGRFIIHGGEKQMLEGRANGDLIVIAFPSIENARNWYESPAYQAIIHNRTQNSEGMVFLVEGVDPDHHATDVLAG